jgi:hypothetical protein
MARNSCRYFRGYLEGDGDLRSDQAGEMGNDLFSDLNCITVDPGSIKVYCTVEAPLNGSGITGNVAEEFGPRMSICGSGCFR